MAAGTDAIIFKAVTDRLIAMPGVLPIAAPNVLFPAAGQPLPPKYLRLAFLPNQTRQITMANDVRSPWPTTRNRSADYFRSQSFGRSGKGSSALSISLTR